MFSLLNSKKIRSWCLFDFGISSYPTLILTFFYGAFYAKTISSNSNVGTSLWGFALSAASILCFLWYVIRVLLSVLYLQCNDSTHYTTETQTQINQSVNARQKKHGRIHY